MANTDRTALRKILQYNTDQKLTNTTDQDFYLNRAEMQVFNDWRKFDPGLFRPVEQTVSTDANGVILLEQNFARLEYLEDAQHNQYHLITDFTLIPWATGYIFLGYDQTTSQKRQIQVRKNGNLLVSTALLWYDIERMLMTSSTSAESAIPEEHRELIADRATYLYYKSKGPAYIPTRDSWLEIYKDSLNDAKEWYKNVSKDPQFAVSYDPDSGTGRQVIFSQIP